mmetsp:Transcript_8034/g.22111  ORF Transcript_8034/g.22111 Transcript_8034/m.22111 type:complete len:233 (+) Transcript_8034:1002-1700(+)
MRGIGRRGQQCVNDEGEDLFTRAWGRRRDCGCGGGRRVLAQPAQLELEEVRARLLYGGAHGPGEGRGGAALAQSEPVLALRVRVALIHLTRSGGGHSDEGAWGAQLERRVLVHGHDALAEGGGEVHELVRGRRARGEGLAPLLVRDHRCGGGTSGLGACIALLATLAAARVPLGASAVGRALSRCGGHGGGERGHRHAAALAVLHECVKVVVEHAVDSHLVVLMPDDGLDLG